MTNEEFDKYAKRADEVYESSKPLIQDLRAIGKSENEIIKECIFWGFFEGWNLRDKKDETDRPN